MVKNNQNISGEAPIKPVKTDVDTIRTENSYTSNKKLILNFGKNQTLHLDEGMVKSPLLLVVTVYFFGIIKSRLFLGTLFVFILYLMGVRVEDIPKYIETMARIVPP